MEPPQNPFDQRPKRPPGLRGKDIGLYYRDLARKRKKDTQKDTQIKLGPNVSVPQQVLRRVEECLEKSTDLKDSERISHEFEKHFHHLLSVNFEEFLQESKSLLQHSDDRYADTLDDRLKDEYLLKSKNKQYRERLKQRERLPAVEQKKEILESILENQVVLVVGSTGCGKTTQVPQLLLDHFIESGQGSKCRIVCTQPRRISAISVAERVAFERCEDLGKSVGYQIRLDSKMPRECGSILYCTTGILLQKMQSDPLLGELKVVILDEIHERSVETDLLMALLKKIIPLRADLKIILMSATVSENVFRMYFDDCQTISISGTLFPVEVLYLEEILQETGFTNFGKETVHFKHRRGKAHQQQKTINQEYSMMIEPYLRKVRSKYNGSVLEALRSPESEGCINLQFIEHLIFHICEKKGPGAILVFLPGYDKISKLHNTLENPSSATGKRLQSQLEIYPLHSMMPTVYQQSVFLPAPAGKRKVILSTIIAETSVTIDDVVYVINTGRTKVSSYNIAANIQTLEEAWVTKANSQQRKGRAGRVQPGICYNLFTRAREATMDDEPTPEILRSKLESIILSLKLLHIKDVFEFLTTLINAPDPQSIKNGINVLKRIEALDDQDFLTPLGMHLARLPVDPQMGKMILMAALFRCLDPITSVAASVSFKSPFFTPLGQENKVDRIKRELAEGARSDHLLIHNVLSKYRIAREDGLDRRFCYNNFLSISIVQQLENMKQQFADLLCGAKFLETSSCLADDSNTNSYNVTLLRAIIAAGLYPNMAQLHKSRQIKNRVFAIHTMSTPEEHRVNFHPSSVNAGEHSFDSHYFVYFLKQKSSAVYLLDATMVFPMAFVIFGDHVEAGHAPAPQNMSYISVGHTYNFVCDQDTCSVILKLRQRLQWLLQKKALDPSPISPNSGDEQIVKAIQILLSLDDAYDYVPDYDNNSSDTESETGH